MNISIQTVIVFIIYLIFVTASVLITNKHIEETYKIERWDRRIIYLLSIMVFLAVESFYMKSKFISFAFFWLCVIAFLDHKSHFIYHWMLLISVIINTIVAITNNFGIITIVLSFLIGFISYLVIYGLALLFYKREAFGFGDVLLMGSLGLLLGVRGTLIASILTFYLAIAVIIILFVTKKKIDKKTEIAFAPFMILSALLVALFEHQIIELYRSIFMI